MHASHRFLGEVLPIRRASGSYPVPNKGYFIQQITRRGAGTLFDEGVGKDKVATSNVNNLFCYFAKKAACSRKRATQKSSFFIVLYI